MTTETPMDARSLKGKVALITGSSSSVGYRVAEELAGRGATIALNGRDADAGQQALKRFEDAGHKAIFEAGDASKYDEIARVVAAVEQRLGGIDILVTSGGSTRPGPTLFHDYKPEDMMKAIEGRVLPRIYPMHAVLPGMRARSSGAIVLVATDAARFPTPGEALIGASGAAVILMTKTLAKEFSRWKIRVNCVALTLTSDTTRYEENLNKPSHAKAIFSKALSRFPFGAAPSATEVARVAAFLASNEASQVTGQTISVNGGLSFGGW